VKGKFQLTLLIAVFFASGFSALVYQVAWQRILTLYYSVENISTTLIVSVYMLGLGIGAVAGGYLSEKIKNRIALYFIIELLIGLFGYISIPFLEFLGKHTAGSSYLISFLLMFTFLCIPTLLMGMTLPLLTKIFSRFLNSFFNTVSYLYYINTLGAAIGAVITSYLFISFWGLDTSIYIAAGMNILIALCILTCSGLNNTVSDTPLYVAPTPDTAAKKIFSRTRLIYIVVFITGFIAIGYEIIWFRVIGTLVKASAYSFSSVLFVYLLGIALGSLYMKRYLVRNAVLHKRSVFAGLQVIISLYVLISVTAYYYCVNNITLFWWLNNISFNSFLHPAITPPIFNSPSTFVKWLFPIIDIIAWPLVFIFVPALCMGAGFPLIASMAYRPGKEGNTVGTVYFFNVLGNVGGGLLTGLLFLQVLGSERTLLLFSLVGLLFIFLYRGRFFPKLAYRTVFFIITVVLGIVFFPARHQLYSTTHPKQFDVNGEKIINEGLDGVVVSYAGDKYLVTYINGISNGGRPGQPFYYKTFLAMSYKKEMKNILVIGFGTGSMVEALLQQDPKPNITLVELSSTLIDNLEQVKDVRPILHDSNVKLVYADGRKFLYNSKEKYDAVFVDPLRSSTSFSNNLYSKQFFTMVSDHLRDDGVFLVWSDETRVTPKTVCSVFPHVNNHGLFCIASKSPLIEDTDHKYRLLNSMPEYTHSLLKIDSALRTYKHREAFLSEHISHPINEDYKPRCEYYLGIMD
jgi:predicted membrane-bound spermidine synthase